MRTLVLSTIVVALLFAGVTVPLAAQEATRTGEIVKIAADAKSFTIKTARGETNVLTTDETVVKDGDKVLKFSDLKVGDSLKVTGVRKGADVEAKEILKQPKS